MEKYEIKHIGYQDFQSVYLVKSLDECQFRNLPVYLFKVTGLTTFIGLKALKFSLLTNTLEIKLISITLDEHMKERDQIQA